MLGWKEAIAHVPGLLMLSRPLCYILDGDGLKKAHM